MAKRGTEMSYELKVTLREVRPAIWRRVRVAGSLTLRDLHHVLQVALGWTDSHLHEFQIRSGPRQVGKTTLLLELASRLGKTSIYAAADGPEAALPGFWERLWTRAEQVAVAEGRAVVLLDEAGSSASRSPTGQPRRLRRSSASRRGRRPMPSYAWDLIRARSAFGKT